MVTTVFTALPVSASELQRIDIDDSFHERVIAWRLDTTFRDAFEKGIVFPHRTTSILAHGDTLYEAVFLSNIVNFDPITSSLPSTLNTHRFIEGYRIIEEWPVGGELTDIYSVFDPAAQRPLVIAGGYRNDSSFLYITPPFIDEYHAVFLGTGEDETGDGHWQGIVRILLVEDFDADGQLEAVVLVNAGRDRSGRALICVDLTDYREEWRLSTASFPNNVVLLNTRQGKKLAVSTQSAAHGAEYDGMSDYYSYLLIIDPSTGELDHRDIVGRYAETTYVIDGPSDSTMLLLHSLKREQVLGTSAVSVLWQYLSLLNHRGEIIATVQDSSGFKDSWRPHPKDKRGVAVYSVSLEGVITGYDSALKPIAQSEPSRFTSCLGAFSDVFDQPFVYVLSDRTQRVYFVDAEFRVLSLVRNLQWVHLVRYQLADSVMSVFLLKDLKKTSYIVRPIKQTFLDIATIYYNLYQPYVLSFVGLLIGALVVTQVYRGRDKRSLRLIAEQKAEIERSHTALQEAQQQIIAAEKYKQAKDIAGGFAHEIRNALFPAKTSLHRLRKADAPAGATDSLERAINRAIETTKVISSYAHLEDTARRRPVEVTSIIDSALADVNDQLTAQGAEVHLQNEAGEASIVADTEQIQLLLLNLLRNSIDAVAASDGKRITLSISRVDTSVEIAVTDSGPGFTDESAARAFDAFYSTKPTTGTGLGLTISEKIAVAHGGSLTIDSSYSGGARVVLGLPDATGNRG